VLACRKTGAVMKPLNLAAMLAFAAPAVAAQTPPAPPAADKPVQYDAVSPLRIFVKPGPCAPSGTGGVVCSGSLRIDPGAPAPQPEAKPEPKPKPGIG